jgi:hypothetical protein
LQELARHFHDFFLIFFTVLQELARQRDECAEIVA